MRKLSTVLELRRKENVEVSQEGRKGNQTPWESVTKNKSPKFCDIILCEQGCLDLMVCATMPGLNKTFKAHLYKTARLLLSGNLLSTSIFLVTLLESTHFPWVTFPMSQTTYLYNCKASRSGSSSYHPDLISGLSLFFKDAYSYIVIPQTI